MPVLGVELLVSTKVKSETAAEKGILYCEIKRLAAKGHLSPNGFLVLKDSQAVLKDRASSKKYPWASNMRERLKEEGVLIENGDHLIFARDEVFSSPSAAAAVVHGGHANGLIAWKNKDGKTLKQIEAT